MSADDHACGRESCGCGNGLETTSDESSKTSILNELGDEDGFHPMGSGWEDEMREMLDETEYDADLGMEMAEDAMRLVAGEITEEEFYAEHHEAVIDEFEQDDRPMAELFETDDAEGHVSKLSALTDGDVSRRDTMKKMGLAGGAVTLGGLLPGGDENLDDRDATAASTHANPDDDEDNGTRYGMVIDLERCDGCLECVVGCMDENRTDTGANWMYVMTWRDEDTEQDNFLVRPCQHCSNAPCAKVCPVQARHIRERDGLVLTNYETCIGCRYCQVACPYGVNYFQWGHPEIPRDELEQGDHGMTGPELRRESSEDREEILENSHDHIHDYRGVEVDSRGRVGTMGKCTFCPSRQDGNQGEDQVGTVACMDACDEAGMSAIHFGDLNDDDSRPMRYLDRRSDEGTEEQNIRFDSELEFTVNGEDTIDVDDGFYSIHLVERRSADDDWQVLESSSVVVSSDTIEESEDFAGSQITDIGGIPSEETGVLYSDEDAEISGIVELDRSGFDDSEEEDFDLELRLVGAGDDQTLSEQTITLTEEDHLVDDLRGPFRAPVTFEVSADDIDVDQNDVYLLYLLVEEDLDDETVQRAADRTRVYVTDDRPRHERPESPYPASRLVGQFDEAPDVLFTDAESAIEATVAYPDTAQQRSFAIVLGDDDEPNTIAQLDYEFSTENTTNSPWGGKQSAFKLLEDIGTQPNIIYLGNEPGPEAEQVDGPVAYERQSSRIDDRQVVDRRKDVTDQSTDWRAGS